MHQFLMLRPGVNIQETIAWVKKMMEDHGRDFRQLEIILNALRPIEVEWDIHCQYDCTTMAQENLHEFMMVQESHMNYAKQQRDNYRFLHGQLQDYELTKGLEANPTKNGVPA